MLGCGRCGRCADGRQHLCADRYEIGVRNGWPGALAERLAVPVQALFPLPGGIGPAAGALVEPGGNALRAVRAASLAPGERLLVFGPGTIGLLAAQIAAAQGAEVHLAGLTAESLEFARSLGFGNAWTEATLPGLRFHAVIDASTGASVPARALALTEPGRRVVYIGLSAEPSLIDTRALVLADLTAVGVLSASGGLEGTIELYSSGAVDPRPLVAATVSLEEVGAVLAGERPPGQRAPKILVDPRR
jgi:threonine dehydrogenase-like Zn-dependent dehydrogenase